MDEQSERLLTPEEAAGLLSISPKTLRDWLRSGKLEGFKVGKQWRVPSTGLSELLTPKQVAERLSISPKTVRHWLRTDFLKGTRAGRLWRVRSTDLEAFLSNRRRGDHK